MNKKSSIFVAFLPTILFLSIFFYWPLAEIILIALGGGTEGWQKTLSNPLFPRFFRFTISQAILTVTFSLGIGTFAGFLLARTKIFAISFFRAAITVPFLFPPLAILLGFVVLFEPAGYLADIFDSYSYNPFSYSGIVLAHTLYNISLVARITEGAFSTEPTNYHYVADTLGASPWMKFRTITLPHIRPALESAALLVFLYSFNSFAIVLILGEVKLQTLEVMIYNQSRLRFNIEQASILATIQLIINLMVIYLYSTRRTYSTTSEDVDVVSAKNLGILPTIITSVIVFLTWAPVLILFRITMQGLAEAPDLVVNQLLSGSYDRFLGTSSLRVLGNTLFFGIMVSIFAIIFSLLSIVASYLERGELIERLSIPLTLLPMGTSAITVSFALLQTHGNSNFFSDIVFIYIISAQLIAALPFASRALFTSWQRVPKDLILVSETLGASKFKTFYQVVVPYIKPALFIASLFSFAISIGEFGATYYLVRGEWTTLSLAIEKLFASRNTLLPNLYASILVLFSLIVFWIIEKLGSVELRI